MVVPNKILMVIWIYMNVYHLDMTHSLPWKIKHHAIKFGKPSISMGHGFHGYVKKPNGIWVIQGGFANITVLISQPVRSCPKCQ